MRNPKTGLGQAAVQQRQPRDIQRITEIKAELYDIDQRRAKLGPNQGSGQAEEDYLEEKAGALMQEWHNLTAGKKVPITNDPNLAPYLEPEMFK